ncbi:hypothetical protein HYW94_00525 [Candidatus Uhrbacteria bacterium]|nr:hypothetical protein [Candidatus Uhrbacteria bacterium]
MHLTHILKNMKKVKLPSAGWYVFTLLIFSGFLVFEIARMSYAQEAFKYPTKLPPFGNPAAPSSGGDSGGGGTYDECAQGIFQGLSTDQYTVALSYPDADVKCNNTML